LRKTVVTSKPVAVQLGVTSQEAMHNLVPTTTTVIKPITHHPPKAHTVLNIKEVIAVTGGTLILHQHCKHLNGLY
jgi:hypothetical protein